MASTADVLTSASTVRCAPPAAAGHGGSLKTQGTTPTLLTVKQQPVLTAAGPAITGCTPQTTNDVPCTVATITGGQAGRITVAGTAVLLSTLAGTTNGTVSGVTGSVTAEAGQQLLREVGDD